MALTKEDLAKVKLPLSDETYIYLHEEEVRRGQYLFEFAPKNLVDAFEEMEIDCFNATYGMGASAVPTDSISWEPPLTEKYKDYPNPRGRISQEEHLAMIAEWHRNHPNS